MPKGFSSLLRSLSPDSTLRRELDHFKQLGIIQQDIEHLSKLFDISLARTAFVRAVGSKTTAWNELMDTLRSGLDAMRATDQRVHPGFPTVLDLLGLWLDRYQLNVPWVGGWARVGIACLSLQKHDDRKVDRLLGYGTPFLPSPDYTQLLTLISAGDLYDDEWKMYEPPPNPLGETYQEFAERMKESWQLRVDAIDGQLPSKRKFDEHAEWTARFHVGRESADAIWATTDLADRRSVPKQIESFAALIELPLRERPVISTGISKYL